MSIPNLETTLKQLRLSGLAGTLSLRLQEAAANRLGHEEFLEILLQDELNVRKERLLSRRTKAADFHRLKTLEDFDWRFNPNIPRKQIYDLATGQFIRQSADLLLIGPPGVGIMPGTGLCRAVRDLPLNNGPEWFSARHNPRRSYRFRRNCKQAVCGAITTWFSVDRHRFGEDLLLQRQIGIKVDLSGFHRLVPQPKRDHGPINASLQQLHRGRMAKPMWRDPLFDQRRTFHPSCRDMFVHQVLDGICTEPPAREAGEKELAGNGQGSFIQASNTRRVVLDMGVQRCFRPFPTHWMCAPGPSVTSSWQSPVSSDKRKPVCMATSSKA